MKKNLFILVLLSMTIGFLQADIVTNTASTEMISYQDATVSLPKFDSSLGTLDAVYLEYTTMLSDVDYQFDNDIDRGKVVTVTLSSDTTGYFSVEVRLTGTGISSDGSDLFISAFTSMTLQPNDGDAVGVFNVGGDDYDQWTPADITATAGGYVDSSVWTDYIGTGDFDSTVNSEILAQIVTYTGVEPGPNALPTGTFSAKVIYEYTVPEPAAIGLIGLGGILTLATSRIRRKNQ